MNVQPHTERALKPGNLPFTNYDMAKVNAQALCINYNNWHIRQRRKKYFSGISFIKNLIVRLLFFIKQVNCNAKVALRPRYTADAYIITRPCCVNIRQQATG